MWTCPKCGRIFEKVGQVHSCHQVTLDFHFKNKDKAKELFDFLVKQINQKIGKCKIITIPCCIHLFGHYDFLAVLPKKDGLEIRFSLHRQLKSPRIFISVPVSMTSFKNCLKVKTIDEIDNQLITWLKESYSLKDK